MLTTYAFSFRSSLNETCYASLESSEERTIPNVKLQLFTQDIIHGVGSAIVFNRIGIIEIWSIYIVL